MKKTLKERFDEKWIPEPNSGCWLWTGGIVGKYGILHINKSDVCNCTMSGGKNGKRNVYAHRLSYELHKGDIDNLFVCHKCDNPICVNPEHLFLGTLQDNSKDMVNKGRSQIGMKNSQSKLTNDQVISIFKDNRTEAVIAEEYNVCRSIINCIKLRKRWKHLTKDLPDTGYNKLLNFKRVLTQEQVIAIYNDPRTSREIAKDYNTANSMVCQIKRRKMHRWITEGLPPIIGKYKKQFTKEETQEIIKKGNIGYAVDELMKEYNCCRSAITKRLNGKIK